MIKHVDLFSGIGGFALAVDRTWGKSQHIFCDIDRFCQAVLKKHWPESEIYADINELIADAERERQLQSKGSEQEKRGRFSDSYILTGGFPCQPFSQAGRRQGMSDDRYLWPQMFRAVQLTRPQWVIAENVRGLATWNDGMVLEQVCTDLESENYEVQSFIIPAVGVNAPHRRDRIWIIANRKSERYGGSASQERGIQPGVMESEKQKGNSARRESQRRVGQPASNWDKNWLKVATELCGVDDGFPAEVDGLKFSGPAHRRERVKSLGNAIVPQVAEQIMKAIKKSEQ